MFLQRFQNLINKPFRFFRNRQFREKLTNTDFSLISSNCNGALILHDLGLRFNSPFVNLYLEPTDFVRFLANSKHYCDQPLQFIKTENHYPVALLDDIKIHFMHYHSEQEAEEKWQSRMARVNWDNLFVMMTDRDGCTYEDLKAFEQLPYKNKVVFTCRSYPEFKSAFCIQGFEKQSQVGDLFAFEGLLGKKYYDQFDYVQWFNQGK